MSKIYDGIMGVVVGDALGVPAEFKRRGSFHIDDMTGFGTHNQKPGTWSDDSSLTLALAESIARKGGIDYDDIMSNFLKWYDNGEFTAYGDVFDVGLATRKALRRYMNGYSPLMCGGTAECDNGNGSLMRILPIAFTKADSKEIMNISALTHAHRISKTACLIYVELARRLIDGMDRLSALKSVSGLCTEEFARLTNIGDISESEIESSGYVVHTLEAAVWCLLKYDNYHDTVLAAVNLGDDTDTTAAVAGGLAGLAFGNIPDEWIAPIARMDWIKELCDRLQAAVG